MKTKHLLIGLLIITLSLSCESIYDSDTGLTETGLSSETITTGDAIAEGINTITPMIAPVVPYPYRLVIEALGLLTLLWREAKSIKYRKFAKAAKKAIDASGIKKDTTKGPILKAIMTDAENGILGAPHATNL